MASDNFLNLFANDTNTVTLTPGEAVFYKGDAGHQMYMVKSGEMPIVDGNHVFETIPPGGVFSEMALISEDPKSAATKATSHSVVIPVDAKRFLYWFSKAPCLRCG